MPDSRPVTVRRIIPRHRRAERDPYRPAPSASGVHFQTVRIESADGVLERSARAAVLVVSAFFVAVLVLSTLVGCAHEANPLDIETVTAPGHAALGAVDIAATEGAKLHKAGAKAAVEVCRERIGPNVTNEERAACLGSMGYSPDQVQRINDALALVRDAYDQIADAMELLEENWPIVAEGIENAKAVLP